VDFTGLVERVRVEGALESAAEAEADLDLTLERLGARLSAPEARALAQRLPPPAGELLLRRVGADSPGGGVLTLAEEVAAAANVAPEEGVRLVRATFLALAAALGELPPALERLLTEEG